MAKRIKIKDGTRIARYKHAEKGIAVLRKTLFLYRFDQAVGLLFKLAGVVLLVITLGLSGSLAYRYISCSAVAEGTVVQMKEREPMVLDTLESIQKNLEKRSQKEQGYPVVEYQIGKKTYTYTSTAPVSMEENKESVRYGMEVHYQPKDPETALLNVELYMNLIRYTLLLVMSLFILMIGRGFDHPSFRTLRRIARTKKENM